jgi:hypothetical protein
MSGPPCLVVSAASGKVEKIRTGHNNKESRWYMDMDTSPQPHPRATFILGLLF